MSGGGSGVDVRTEGAIVKIVLAQPDLHNRINSEIHHQIKLAFEAASEMKDVRAIIFAAEGKTFSAGGDLNEVLAQREDPVQRSRMRNSGRQLLLTIADCPVPIITALQGDAIGLGATLVLLSDAIVAARTAHIADPHVVIGLAAGDGGCIIWPEHVGLLRAKRYLLTGDRLSAADAYAMGLITDLVDRPELVMPAAETLATRIAALPPLAVQNTKRAFSQLFRARLEELFEYGLSLEMETFVSDDVVEAIQAFRERRVPTFHGR